MEESYRKGKKIAYFQHNDIGKYYYGKGHPMKPKRIAMAHSLIVNLGLYRELNVYRLRAASEQEMIQFHEKDYIKQIKKYIPVNLKAKMHNQCGHDEDEDHNQQCNPSFKLGESSDCPTFDGLYNFCQLSSGGSIDCAHLVINQDADIAINWSGGLHHAKKSEASGFCYVNDIVLCILELLKYYPRVIYIDVDVHHGDGVEEAFFLTNRVMTVSFHQYGDDFFPGSGNIDSIGDGQGFFNIKIQLGKYHSINVPLKPGVTDDQFEQLFKSIMQKIMECYIPQVIVLQSGADSLAYDKLGYYNLSTKGHGKCLEYMMTFGVPIILLGGGGYNVPNVARCWAYETGLTLGKKLDGLIPTNEQFYEYYGPDHKLHINAKSQCENKNSNEELHKLKTKIFEYLKEIESAPGLSFNYTPDLINFQSDQETNQYGNEIDDGEESIKGPFQLNRAKNF